MQKLLILSACLGTLALPAAPALAADSPHTFTANVGLFSEYVFRGLSQTNGDPAVQGGLDYAYDFGPASAYAGTWASNISWLRDSNQYSSSSLEWDWYGGLRGNIGASDFTYDVGFLYYYYPGTVNSLPAFDGQKGDTQELYGALGWKWFTLKYSYSVSSKTFAVRDSAGTWYLDLSAAYPVGDTGLALQAHYGIQKYSGTDPRNVAAGGVPLSNDELYSYNDWKLGATYDLGKATKVLSNTTLGAYYAGTSRVNAIGYGSPADCNALGCGAYPKNIAKGKFVAYVQRTF
ncbi:MAG: hypothetical protein IT515_02225 [Burkholderiales bacterium]|nr:hypothetical protein [Burkholderiales bacterium]